jgi:hypothetical protein
VNRLLVVFSFAVALSACTRPADPVKVLRCQAVEGAGPLLDRPKGDLILLDGADAAADVASQAIGCLAAARGERVIWGATREAAARLVGPVRALSSRGAHVDIFHFLAAPAGEERAAAEARNESFARSVATAQTLNADRVILVVDPPDAARAPVGLSGQTWRPLGARLPGAKTISLRAERSLRPGIRVRLIAYEDVPKRGAARRYDGIVEIGPAPQQSPGLDSAGARSR